MTGHGICYQETLDRLVALIAETLGRSIPANVGLLASGVTSVELVMLLARASSEWGVEIPVEVLFERGDLIGLARYLADADDGRPRQEVARPVTESDRSPVSGRRAMRNRIRQAIEESRA
jgi:hypothetical protein